MFFFLYFSIFVYLENVCQEVSLGDTIIPQPDTRPISNARSRMDVSVELFSCRRISNPIYDIHVEIKGNSVTVT